LVTVKSIGIESDNSPIIRDITVETAPHGKDFALWNLTITAHLESAFLKESKGTFTINLNEHSLIENQSYDLKPESDGTMRVKFVIPLTNIKITPWFPNGVADNIQTLYDLEVKLNDTESRKFSTKNIRIGFRKFELIQGPIKPEGLSFYFKINNKFFIRKARI
jgi:beta-galactosidase/beta-glucuronidase